MPRAARSLADYKMDVEWREIFGSSIDLTACMVDILDSFNMAAEGSDIGQPPDEVSVKRKSTFLHEYEVSSVDSTHTCLSTDSGLSGVNDLDRNSIWRNSSSSSGSSASHQSALSLISNTDGPANDAASASASHRHSSLSTGSKTHFIMDEVIQTEKNYVEDLRQICQAYLQPMRQSALFSSEDVDLVFANLEEILIFHKIFFAVLLPPDLTGPAYLAQRFNEHAHDFEIYTEYCINFPASVKHLAQIIRNQPEWFKDRQAEIGHSLQLGTYLLKPIQRILKYHLLLQKLLDNCDCDAEGYQSVLQAYECMRNIAQKINEVQNQKERKIRLEELELFLVELPVNLNLRDFGGLLLDDVFRLTGAKGERNLFLFENGLLFVKRKEDGTFLYKNYIAHSNIMLSEVIPENPLHFSVIAFDNPKALTVIEAKSMEQKRAWTSRLKEMMLKNFGVKIPEHVQQLVMQLGEVHRGGSTENSPRRFRPTIFHSPAAPDYLHKRRAKSPARDTFLRNSENRFLQESRRQTAPILDFKGVLPHSEEIYDDLPKESPKKASTNTRKNKTKTTAVFHVSTDYIPRMKEDEFMYEEIHVTNDGALDKNSARGMSVSSLQDSFMTISPRRNPRRNSADVTSNPFPQDVSSNQISGIFKSGFRTVFGKARQVLKPVMKSFNSDESFESQETLVPTSNSELTSQDDKFDDGMDSFTEAVNALTFRPLSHSVLDGTHDSNGFYEKNLDLLDRLSIGSGRGDGDSTLDSDKEDWHDSSFSTGSPSPTDHVKLRRTFANASEEGRRTGISIKRKGAIKKRPSMPRTKSAPGTPLATDKITTLTPKGPSGFIQQKIRSLEERAFWKSSASMDKDFQANDSMAARTSGSIAPLAQMDSDTATSSLSLNEPKMRRESYVTMMVNKIESGSDVKLS